MSHVAVVIPARYGSTRFPGKPLALLLGKPMLQHTYERCIAARGVDQVWIATDDERIAQAALQFGAPVIMTPTTCPTGSERVAAAISACPALQQASIIINVQGDEPALNPEILSQLVEALQQHPEVGMSTACSRLATEEDFLAKSVVKVVRDLQGNALYFSRASMASWMAAQAPSPAVWRHVGVYAFRLPVLQQYVAWSATPLQAAEDLEQLRLLEHGVKIQVVEVDEPSIGVDRPEDIQRVESVLCSLSTCS